MDCVSPAGTLPGGAWMYRSMSCAPSSEPNVGCRFAIPIWNETVGPELITVSPVSRNEPGANTAEPSEFVAVG